MRDGAASMLDAGMGFCYQRAVRAKLIADAKLVVVKLGTGILTDRRNRLASSRIKQIVAQVVNTAHINSTCVEMALVRHATSTLPSSAQVDAS